MSQEDTNKAPQADNSLINPLDVQKSGVAEGTQNEVIKGIVDAGTAGPQEKLLDAAPEIDMSLLENATVQKSPILMILKWSSGFLVFLLFASFIFFNSQLSTRLDVVTSAVNLPNLSQNLESSTAEVIKLKTDENFYRFLQLKAYLDLFSFDGDAFIRNYDSIIGKSTSEAQRQVAKEDIEDVKRSLAQSFEKAREKIKVDISAPLASNKSRKDLEDLFLKSLQDELKAKSKDLKKNKSEGAQIESKNLTHISKLVGNKKLKSLLLKTDFASLSDEEIYALVKDMNKLVVNDLSTIQKIKEERVKWSEIINQIELSTVAVDSYYNQKSRYDIVGGIRYTSYDFDTNEKRVTISGETKRIDNQNFSMIARLIDEFNNSDLFENAEMKTFNKSGTFLEGYTANLKLSFDLDQGETEAKKNKKVSKK